MPRLREIPPRASSVGMLMLLTVVAFVATNTVLSPQFHLWLVPLAALVLEGRAALPSPAVRAAWLVFVATMIVPTFFPHRQFGQGLGPALTVLLVLRNLLLVYATISLCRAASARGKIAEPLNPTGSGNSTFHKPIERLWNG
jgi:hypothetical protein